VKLYQYYSKNTVRSLVYASSAISAFFLGAALVGQYGFNLHPCELCIAQRVPYALIAMIGLISGMKIVSEPKLRKVAILCIVLFITDAGIAAYHTGVETGIFKGPSACTNDSKPNQTLEEMRAAIMNAQLVPCDQPMAYIFGLSMAAWNMIAASGTALVLTYLLRKSGKV
jgi:disulfide bond formation protein DsbB